MWRFLLDIDSVSKCVNESFNKIKTNLTENENNLLLKEK